MQNHETQGPRSGAQPNRRPASPNRQAPQRRSGPPPQGGRPEAPQGGGRKRPPQNEGSRWIRAILMVLATISLCIFLAFFFLDTANDLLGLNQEDHTIEIEIPKNATNGDAAKILSDAGVIKNALVFRIYADMKTKDRQFQPGSYVFNSIQGYDEIIVALKSGDYVKKEVRVTFIESETIAEVAAKLEEKEICDAQEFIDYLQTADYDYEWFNAISDDPLRFRKLEGYIFPDTYDFYVGESVADVARRFLRNFNDKMTEELRASMLEMDLSMDETIILASIIQKEAGEEDDMAMVSSVFHNRMALSQTYPRLQSDVTIFYVNNNIKNTLAQANQQMYDAYNTYEREGLPVGAICNPGMDAIKAALNPAKTDFYYFVTDSDGQFYYAKTAEEHYQNVAKAKAVGGEAHGIDTQ